MSNITTFSLFQYTHPSPSVRSHKPESDELTMGSGKERDAGEGAGEKISFECAKKQRNIGRRGCSYEKSSIFKREVMFAK